MTRALLRATVVAVDPRPLRPRLVVEQANGAQATYSVEALPGPADELLARLVEIDGSVGRLRLLNGAWLDVSAVHSFGKGSAR